MDMIGGQAVIEGVLMRRKQKVAIATIKGGKITVLRKRVPSYARRFPLLKKPFIRGAIGLWQMMVLGIDALLYSANKAEDDDEQIGSAGIVTMLLVSALITVGVFIALPLFLTRWLTGTTEGILFNLLDGLIRIAFFVFYVFFIGFSKGLRRVFEYHGAEHMAVHCHEHKLPLTVKNVSKFSPQHARCGTSFLIIVMIISILVFSFVMSGSFVINLIGRILLIPVVAGISYEVLQFSARHQNSMLFRALSAPGIWLQHITTRKPSASQIRVAIAALKAVR